MRRPCTWPDRPARAASSSSSASHCRAGSPKVTLSHRRPSALVGLWWALRDRNTSVKQRIRGGEIVTVPQGQVSEASPAGGKGARMRRHQVSPTRHVGAGNGNPHRSTLEAAAQRQKPQDDARNDGEEGVGENADFGGNRAAAGQSGRRSALQHVAVVNLGRFHPETVALALPGVPAARRREGAVRNGRVGCDSGLVRQC